MASGGRGPFPWDQKEVPGMAGKTKMVKGFKFTKMADGRIKVQYEKYPAYIGTQDQVAMWVWNMADNHDVANHVSHELCRWMQKDLLGDDLDPRLAM